MTTDITELAQSEINDALAQLKQISEYPTPSTQYARVLRKYILALVEALEKAQQVDEELCRLLPPGAEYMDPPDGGDVTPLEGVHRMVADYRQRIAELESRTVTVKLPNQTQFDDPLSAYEAIEKCKEALTAQGIKWEAE
ncbi:hypothetical protein [Klebsiella pneumoniae]|uniref:hypothetical protein n=1 Tax=Klebsiella pneumoniae TaxID=573 RepID=UPI000B4AA291|nr:hypothetical protein [Klebsiella pneumoniae]ASC26558.1 hypothetical protein AM399_01010 [Klebsiella pneumoniae]ASC41266.1 hypothetical protein AM392_20220 [Klebsiella pneumoniae]EKM7480864.1 hypothetical protein [Klebsiella pneumoniae]EMB6036433.1 hypothetical protein [Klebsiella pneumoniae]MBD8342412.1 hypothetical protein [Klebsiella pneumoniae]